MLAMILAGMPDLLQRTLSEHTADEFGYCRECRSPTGAHAVWPCAAREIAEEAIHIRSTGMRAPAGP